MISANKIGHYLTGKDDTIYSFQLDRKHLNGNKFSCEVGNGYWKVHSSNKPVIMGKRRASIRHVKFTEGPIIGPFSKATVRYVKVMTSGYPTYRKDIAKDLDGGKYIIGYKTRLVYYEGKEAKHGTKTNWLTDVYRVNRNYLPKSIKAGTEPA